MDKRLVSFILIFSITVGSVYLIFLASDEINVEGKFPENFEKQEIGEFDRVSLVENTLVYEERSSEDYKVSFNDTELRFDNTITQFDIVDDNLVFWIHDKGVYHDGEIIENANFNGRPSGNYHGHLLYYNESSSQREINGTHYQRLNIEKEDEDEKEEYWYSSEGEGEDLVGVVGKGDEIIKEFDRATCTEIHTFNRSIACEYWPKTDIHPSQLIYLDGEKFGPYKERDILGKKKGNLVYTAETQDEEYLLIQE